MTTSTPEDAAGPAKQDTEVNPKKRPMTEDNDTEKLAARREANRIHALKSRQRSKALLQELQRTVTQLSGEKAELERENAVMRAQIEVLQQQNLALTQSQRMLLMRSGQLGGAPGAAMAAFAPGLFGLSQAASMPAAAAPVTTAAPTANSVGTGTAPSGGEQQNGLDQAAVAAAAQAMIQGQAAAAAAAASGFQPQFQQFMAGFMGAGGVPAPSGAAAPTPAASAPGPQPTAVATATPTPAPTPNTAPVAPQAPPTTALPTTTEPARTMEEVHMPPQGLPEEPVV